MVRQKKQKMPPTVLPRDGIERAFARSWWPVTSNNTPRFGVSK
jgi:hypothetical protein